MAKGTVVIDTNRCKGCELCVTVCPQHVLHIASVLNTRGYYPVELDDPESRCTGCGLCAVMCPDVVFTVYRMQKASPRVAALAQAG
jgi:2-oxoglutarate ferredoxin oxidoreductase subunit delta